jgi:hypothetical protein
LTFAFVSTVDYAALQTRVKDDLAMVEKRKRMLQTFLNRVAKHPVLGRDHVFHRFLESGVSWVRSFHYQLCKAQFHFNSALYFIIVRCPALTSSIRFAKKSTSTNIQQSVEHRYDKSSINQPLDPCPFLRLSIEAP